MATETLDDPRPARRARGVTGRIRTAVRGPLAFLRRLAREALDDNIVDLGAMMAYYAVLALFPMMVFIVTLALLVIDPSTIHAGVAMVTRALPATVQEQISAQVTRLIGGASAGFALSSLAVALWGASRGTASLGTALDAIFDCGETRPWWKRQLIAVTMTLVIAVMAIIALGLLVVGPIAGHYVADRFGLGGAFDVAWGIGRWLGAGLLVMVVCALVYTFLPDRRTPFRVFTVGSVVGVSLWLVISFAFGTYLAYFNSYDATYGALGGAVIFLTWLWLSNIALLLGAEVNDVLSRTRREKAEAYLADRAVAHLDDESSERE